jgi:hypothetical protein
VAFFVEVGLLLIVLPWSGFWERNYFAQAWPAFGALVTNNFARGAISGLGLVNLVAGFSELVPVFAAPAAPTRRADRRGRGSAGRALILHLVTDSLAAVPRWC